MSRIPAPAQVAGADTMQNNEQRMPMQEQSFSHNPGNFFTEQSGADLVPRTPLLLDAFWRKCGGVMLLDYDHYAHKDWYRTHYPALWNRGATHADPVSIITPATLGTWDLHGAYLERGARAPGPPP